MKVALITDQHFGVRNDSIQFHEYFSKFYNDFFFPTLAEHGINTIIELGDIFDRRKYVNFDTLYRAREYFFDPIVDAGITLHCIAGNHDVYFKNTNRVNAPTLLISEAADNIKVYDTATEITVDGTPIVIVPWINQDNYQSMMELLKDTNSEIVMGHLELQGFQMYRNAFNDHGYDHKLFSKFDIVMSGHFHHKSSKDNIHYLGAPYEMTWSDYDDARGFHIFDTDTKELQYYRNPYSMFIKVFYDDANMTEDELLRYDVASITGKYIKVIVKNKDNPYIFDLFMDRLNSAEPHHIQTVEDNLHLDIIGDEEIIDEAEDTSTIIRKYIDNLNISNPKPMYNLFNELYNEALANE